MLTALVAGSPPLSIIVSVVITFIVLTWSRTATSRDKTFFRDKFGGKMKHVRGDTRVRRFSHGREVSDEGYALAGGDPYIIRNGSRNEVVLCRPQHLQEFFSRDGREHWKAPDGNMGYFFHRLLGECVGAHSGETWRTLRHLFDPIYTPAAMSKLTTDFRVEVQNWLGSIVAQYAPGGSHKDPFRADITRKCASLPLKLVATTLYGDSLTSKAFEDLIQLSRTREELGSNAFLGSRMVPRLYALLPTRANHLLNQYTHRFREFNLRMIHDAEQNRHSCPVMQAVRGMSASGRVGMVQVIHTIDEILFENLDVASSALSYLLLNIAGDAAAQNTLRREVLQHISNGGTEDSYLAKSDTFLELCCAESRRLCPTIWFTFCERSPSEKLIGGFLVPANTDVTIDWKRLSIDSPLWSFSTDSGRKVDGYDFYPARYQEMSKSDYRYSLVGYGAGARKCIGQHFASMLMRVVLFEVVSKYKISTRADPWTLGFRRDKFVITPQDHELAFTPV